MSTENYKLVGDTPQGEPSNLIIRLSDEAYIPTDEANTKEAIKEGLSEWLNDKFSEFGKFSLRGIFALMLVALVYLWATSQGWKI